MPDILDLIVEESAVNQRLDVFLVAAVTASGIDCSRAGVQRWIKEGFVTLGGLPQANPAKKTRLGEQFRIDLPEIEASELIAEDIPLDILYEDDDLLVLNKAPGMT